MLWDATNLYIAAELSEPDVWGTITQRDAVIFRDNDFEVFIDPDGDTQSYYELEVNSLGTAWDLFLPKPYRDEGHALDGWDIHGLQVGTRVDGTLNRPGDRDRRWTVELALPWEALGDAGGAAAPPRPGDQWRINFSRVQWRTRVEGARYVKVTDPASGKPFPEDNWVWSPQGVVNMHYPELWGFVQFSGHAVGQGTDLFVPRAEDALKWMLRLVYYRERAWHAAHGAYTASLADLRLTEPPLPGRSWPPALAVTPHGFEASLPLPPATDSAATGPGARGAAGPARRLVLTTDGAVR
jgi:hypothetical protein